MRVNNSPEMPQTLSRNIGWKSEHFKEWRDTVLKAGDQALAAFDKRFVPAPSSIDRVTVSVAEARGPNQREPHVLVILATTKPIDRDAFLTRTLPGVQKAQANGKTYYVEPKSQAGLHFLNERTLAFGPVAAVQAALTKPAARQGDLAAALQQAQAGKPLVVALNPTALAALLPPGTLQQVPPPFRALAQAKQAILTVDLAKNGRIDLRLVYANAQQVGQAEAAAKAGLQMARMALAQGREEATKKVLGDGKPGTLDELPEAAGALFGLGVLNRLDELLAAPPLQRDGTALRVSVQLPQGGAPVLSLGAISVGLLLPAVQKVRESANRLSSQNNLKQMALALYNYHDTYGGFPSAAICDKNGKPLLSWRVAILPFLEQDTLYKQFKLDEPWNSAHNTKLIPLMPKIYAVPAAPPKPGETHYRVFVGGGAAFDLAKRTRLADLTDGTSNTLLIVETTDTAVWTKPDDILYDPRKPLPKLGGFYANGIFNAAFFDGSVRALRVDLPEATLRALITRAGGEIIPKLDR